MESREEPERDCDPERHGQDHSNHQPTQRARAMYVVDLGDQQFPVCLAYKVGWWCFTERITAQFR
jgi:hypothetical protein